MSKDDPSKTDLNFDAVCKSGSRDAMIEKWDGDPDARPLEDVDIYELAGADVPVQKAWDDPAKRPSAPKGWPTINTNQKGG